MSVRYPVAVNAEAALQAPQGRAVREREALALASGLEVEFVRELVGPAFATREAGEAAWPEVIDRPGAPGVQPEDRFCELMEVLEPAARQGGLGVHRHGITDRHRAILELMGRRNHGPHGPHGPSVPPTPAHPGGGRDPGQVGAISSGRGMAVKLRPVLHRLRDLSWIPASAGTSGSRSGS